MDTSIKENPKPFITDDETAHREIEKHIEEVNRGNKDLYHNIAWIYDDALKDYENAEMYYRKSIEADSVHKSISIFNLADILTKRLLNKDYEPDIAAERRKEGIKLFEQIADEDVEAIRMLGILHHRTDHAKAISYYEKGIERGDPRCMVNLAQILKLRDEKDKSKAFELAQRACDAGFGPGIDELAKMYRLGKVISKDKAKEYETLSGAAYEKLTRFGRYNLAWFYLYDYDYRDYEKALKIHRELIEEFQDADSMYDVGKYYTFDTPNRDYKKAIEYFIQSGKNGCADGYQTAIEYITTRDDYAGLVSDEEYTETFKKLMKMYINAPFKSKKRKLSVRTDILTDIMKDYFECKRRLLEYDLAPPMEGGRLYHQAFQQFKEDVASVKK